MILLIFATVAFIATPIFIIWQHRNDEYYDDRPPKDNPLYNSIYIPNEKYSYPEEVFQTLDDAGIKINFIFDSEYKDGNKAD